MSTIEQVRPVSGTDASPLAELKPERRIAAFDGMRGIAVMMVIIGHCFKYAFNGQYGVDIFFVLSGYLITALLLQERAKNGRISFKNFYMRRVLRLFPALLLLVAMVVPVAMLLGHSWYRTLGDAAITLAYISNWTRAFGERPFFFAHTWSLSIEEQFYLIWPVTVLAIYWVVGRSRKGAVVCLLGAIAILLHRRYLLGHPPANWDEHRIFSRVYYGLDTHGDGLLAGAALAFWTPVIPRVLAIIIGWAGILAMVRFVVWGSIVAGYPDGMHPYEYAWVMTLAILLGILNDRRGVLAWILGLKPLAWIGVISYGLYLFHFPILLQLGEVWKWRPMDVMMVGVPLTFAIATVSFYLVERPCLRLKELFRPGSNWGAGMKALTFWRRDAAGN